MTGITLEYRHTLLPTSNFQLPTSMGFTLLELLIALAVFSVTALVVLEQSSRSVRQQSVLEEKTLATWAAENSLAALRLQRQWPSLGIDDEKVTLAGREWHLRLDTQSTPEPLLRKTVVQVRSSAEANGPVVTLTGYFHKW